MRCSCRSKNMVLTEAGSMYSFRAAAVVLPFCNRSIIETGIGVIEGNPAVPANNVGVGFFGLELPREADLRLKVVCCLLLIRATLRRLTSSGLAMLLQTEEALTGTEDSIVNTPIKIDKHCAANRIIVAGIVSELVFCQTPDGYIAVA